jgi:hypothetical protein
MRFHLYRRASETTLYANRLLVIGLFGKFIYIELKGIVP